MKDFPQKLWILGAGRFGTIAAKRLSQRFPDSSFTLVDARPDKLKRFENEPGFSVRTEDAIGFLSKASFSKDVWIVPAVPVHVVFEWFCARLGEIGRVQRLKVPEVVDAQVPNPYRAQTGTLYTSFATFLCPDNCPEPEKVCTSTGRARQGNLFEHLGRIELAGAGLVIVRSLQLAPGVGGYRGDYIEEKLLDISRRPGSYLVATSCRCHGVIDFLRWDPN